MVPGWRLAYRAIGFLFRGTCACIGMLPPSTFLERTYDIIKAFHNAADHGTRRRCGNGVIESMMVVHG